MLSKDSQCEPLGLRGLGELYSSLALFGIGDSPPPVSV